MAAEGKKGQQGKKITDDQRFRYIGFDVFPGKPKDLFKSDAEKTKHENAVKAKREKGDIIRDECTLLEPRVSLLDRVVLTIACVMIIGTLFIPWFSLYNEVVEETITPASTESMMDSTALTASTDSLGAMANGMGNAAASVIDSAAALVATAGTETPTQVNDPLNETSSEEVLHGYVAKKKFTKHYANLPGYGIVTSIGSVGGYVFSSGIILILTGIFFIVYFVLSVLLPLYTLYGVYGLKGNEDQKALVLKKLLKFNWIPVLLFVGAMFLSFLGGSYGFNSADFFTSLGSSYGPGIFLGSLSYGIVVSLGAYILIAIKGVEI